MQCVDASCHAFEGMDGWDVNRLGSGLNLLTLVMYTPICWYLRVLPALHRPEVIDIGVNTIMINMTYA